MADHGPSQQVVDEILDRLSNDNDFREQVLGDPVSAFKPYGITIDPATIPFARKLPTRADLESARASHANTIRTQCEAMLFILK
ncbi:MAG TPA: NHLP-related RiPP peptide [Rhodanobacteraceae bacterium]|jgi:putative modified peptide|nr:NHLP-related RiPP peptide [Rhodanobacteraceae bacterium]